LASDSFMWRPIDFTFDFATTGLAVGGSATTGQAAAYGWRGDNNASQSAFMLDNETVGEITGIEYFGPYVGSRRARILYARPAINGVEIPTVNMNERMCPGATNGSSTQDALSGFRYGQANINLGMPLLGGGLPSEATPKIAPGESLTVKVTAPSAVEGGEAIATPMIVRVWLLTCRGEDKLNYLLDYYHGSKGSGLFSGSKLNCGFDVGDLELGEVQSYENMVGEGSQFPLGSWSEIHGGTDVGKPKVSNYISYAINRAASTTNQWYQFTLDGSKVYYDWQIMQWKFTKKDALKVTHVGVSPHKNLRSVRMYRSNRPQEYIQDVKISGNSLQLPAGQYLDNCDRTGPGKLSKSWLVWNEIGSIEIGDNGTAIPATAASDYGTMLAVYGKRYEMI